MDYNIEVEKKPKGNTNIFVNMTLFLAGKLVSLLGTSIYSFAMGLYVLKLTGSGFSFAVTIVLGMLPRIILGPFAGTIADNSNRKRMVVSMDLLSGGLMFLVYMMARANGLSIVYIYLSAFLLTVFNTFFSVAFDASIPNIVNDERLMKLNAFNHSITSLTSIVGPVLGGLAYGLLDIKFFILFNGISFFLSGLSESFINFNINQKDLENKGEVSDTSKERLKEKKPIMGEMIEGFKYLKNSTFLLSLVKYSVFINFFFSGLLVALPYIVVTDLMLSSEQYGTIEGAFAIGSFSVSIILSMLPEFKKKFKVLSLGLFGVGILFIGIGLPTTGLLPVMSSIGYMIYFIVVMFLIGSILVLVNLPLNVSLQRETPDAYRGRVFGALTTMSMAIMPLGMVINGLLIDLVPSYFIPVISGTCFLLVIILMARNEELRKI